jgi:predicted phosphodiesterase
MPKAEKWVIGSDLQFPYLDHRVWGLFLDFVADLKPTGVVLNGDVNDFYSVSSYDKDPARAKRLVDETGELRDVVMTPLRKALKGGKLAITEGNHEDRLRRYLWKQAPALAGMNGLGVPEIYACKAYGALYVPQSATLELGCLRVMHGHLLSQHSGQTAKKHVDRHGTSVIVGHSHRLGAFYKTDMAGTHGGWECGCLCAMDAEYENFPNWQQGWAVVTVFPSRLFAVELVPVIGGKFAVYGGKEWRS